MYILKNAVRNITRQLGRNALIGSIIMVITLASCITLTINNSGKALIDNYKTSNPLEVSLALNPMEFRGASSEEMESFKVLDIDTIKEIGKLDTVKDYYYIKNKMLNSETLEKIDYEQLFQGNGGPIKPMSTSDFTLLAYSDMSYNQEFLNGTNKIIDGDMMNDEINTVVIAEELALENDLSVNDEITLNDEDNTYKLKIVGIYETISDTENVRTNTILTNMETMDSIPSNEESNFKLSNLDCKFFMENDDIEKFSSDILELGVSKYYEVRTNEDSVLEALKPIENIKNFSITFLILVLIVGAFVLTTINLFNIRERKYEIGVLRAIGMTKFKVTLQLVLETVMVSFVAVIIGTVIGASLTSTVSNSMLSSEIESIKTEQVNVQNNFGGRFNKEQFKNKNVAYIDSLETNLELTTILELVFVSIILTILSSSVAVMFVNNYEPNKILQNR